MAFIIGFCATKEQDALERPRYTDGFNNYKLPKTINARNAILGALDRRMADSHPPFW